jgi:predicted nucleic acid-binding Zn ribbon protein
MLSAAATKESDTVALVNISTETWPPRYRSYFGSLQVLSPQPGEPFAITPIRGFTSIIDFGDKRFMDIRISAREVAEDLAREINGDSGDGSFHGVFVAAGPAPTDAELADARQRLAAFHQKLVASADLEWERTHNHMFITDLERRAARQLGLEKPWLYDARPQADCPVCAEKIKPGVAVCKCCGAILDREKAAQYGLGLHVMPKRPHRDRPAVSSEMSGAGKPPQDSVQQPAAANESQPAIPSEAAK